ncbi:hypothetical protein JOF53_001093 [Crossiella equi]|uniref:Uncharacterized protein n=1 Tax=Crossiella equi TaxID=130796 RepID=A0ABS5A7D3_9PSEU|nr:hypothetical protein [Crossiella equi]MBP2472221.1 hypothetical protein [Crossiella equi]
MTAPFAGYGALRLERLHERPAGAVALPRRAVELGSTTWTPPSSTATASPTR